MAADSEDTAASWKAYLFVALVAAWPLINFAISNVAWLGGAPRGFLFVAAITLAVMLLAVAGLWILLRVFGPRWTVRLAFFVAAGVLLFFSFAFVESGAKTLFKATGLKASPVFGYIALAAGIPLLLVLIARRKTFLDLGLIAAAVAVGVSIVTLAMSGGRSAETPAGSATPAASQAAPADPSLPSIYHVLADQYARADQMQAILGFDNGPFLTALEARGFRVVPHARSNYRETGFSIPSIHAMGYPFTDERPLPPTLANVFADQSGSTAAMRKAWSLGYDYLHVDTNVWGVTACPPNPRVVCLTPRDTDLSSWDVEILDAINRMTPISYFFSFNAKLSKATSIDDVTDAVAGRGFDRPQFLFAHTMQPHSPYTRAADCTPLETVQFSLSGPGNPDRYKDAVQCVNKMMLRFADTVAAFDPDAIIIFSSDHGSKFTLDAKALAGEWTKPQFEERYGALLAVRGPQRCLDQLTDDMSLVNIYRWAFACAEGKPAELLENRFYDVSYDALTEGRKVRRFPADGPPA